MALVLKDRVKETTTTTGTGTVTLAGAATGYQSFSAIGNGNTTWYCIAGQTGGEWEVGLGTYTSSGTTLSRDTVIASSNSGSLVSFTSGTKDVFVTYPAENVGVSVGLTPPASPVSGALWWDDAAGKLKIYYVDANSSQWVDATTGTVGGSGIINAQTFTSSGTWTKPSGASQVRVIAIGGGGGGGSGRKGAAGTLRVGGAGGWQGAFQDITLQASDVSSTVSVTVGTGGTGGASQTTNSTSGNAGTAGGDTTFGSYITVYGGLAGAGGGTTTTLPISEEKCGFDFVVSTATPSGVLTKGLSGIFGATYAIISASNVNGSFGGAYGNRGPGGGAGGGTITTANSIATAFVSFGGTGSWLQGKFSGGTASTTDGSTGGNGTAATANQPMGGGGGGCGQASLTGNAGNGGDGALYGGGGGGGGASVDSTGNSGAGGNGADGICVVISW